MDSESNALIDNAFRCYRLAAVCTDFLLAQQLREIGAEYSRRALARGANPKLLPMRASCLNPACGDPPSSGAP